MGGGGGGGYGKPIIERLSKVAQDSFKDAQPEKRNVFISFDYRDVTEVNLLRGQAKNENNDLEFNDHSLKAPFDSEEAEYIRTGIREKIRQASVVLIYVSEQTHESQWVDWEAREGVAQGKGVICVYKGDTPPTKLPKFVNDLGLRFVPWKHGELGAEIENSARNRS